MSNPAAFVWAHPFSFDVRRRLMHRRRLGPLDTSRKILRVGDGYLLNDVVYFSVPSSPVNNSFGTTLNPILGDFLGSIEDDRAFPNPLLVAPTRETGSSHPGRFIGSDLRTHRVVHSLLSKGLLQRNLEYGGRVTGIGCKVGLPPRRSLELCRRLDAPSPFRVLHNHLANLSILRRPLCPLKVVLLITLLRRQRDSITLFFLDSGHNSAHQMFALEIDRSSCMVESQ